MAYEPTDEPKKSDLNQKPHFFACVSRELLADPPLGYASSHPQVKECYMYKLGWCINGPYCRYRHVKLPGPPPSILETIKLKLPSGGGGQPVVHHRVVARDGGGTLALVGSATNCAVCPRLAARDCFCLAHRVDPP